MKKQLSDKNAFAIAVGISAIVLIVVLFMFTGVIHFTGPIPAIVYKLPILHAILNSLCAILLVLSLKAIKNKKVELHKRLNLMAFGLSSLFLISYILYHTSVPSTSYGGQGLLKTTYFIVLFTHILGSIIVLPLILVSFWYGLNKKIAQHRKIVRFSYPIWLYVTISGVLVYLFISPYYQF